MDLLRPQWPAPANVRAACSTRAGGVSGGVYESLNLGDHVGDDPLSVIRNRALFAGALGVRPAYLQQVHGCDVLQLGAATHDGVRADACFTQERGVACTIMVADCLPVLFATADGSRVGAAHAGWRGLWGGVLEEAVAALAPQPSTVIAWLGPCIGPEAFEVGDEVRAAFIAHSAGAKEHFRPYRYGKFLADLPALARMRLKACGVTRLYGNDGSRDWCTVSNPSRFFSHRRDRVSGRFAAAVWLG